MPEHIRRQGTLQRGDFAGSPAPGRPLRHPTKIAIAVRADLAVWQKLNVVAFLAGGIAARHPELIGGP